MQAVAVFGGVRPTRDDGGGAGVAGGLDGCDNGRIVMSGGVAKPVDRHVVSLLNSAPCDGHLVVQLLRVQGDQVGVAEALRIELPARRDQTTDLCPAEAPLGG